MIERNRESKPRHSHKRVDAPTSGEASRAKRAKAKDHPDADVLWSRLYEMARALRLVMSTTVVVSETLRSTRAECDVEAAHVLQRHVADALFEQLGKFRSLLTELRPERSQGLDEELEVRFEPA